jgi:hypothetical protein
MPIYAIRASGRGLCGLWQSFACHGGERSDYTGLLVMRCQSCRLDGENRDVLLPFLYFVAVIP